MKRATLKTWGVGLCTAALILTSACGGSNSNTNSESNSGGQSSPAPAELTKVEVVLDWTPNTNHTGLYVADAKGYYEEQGLDVDIILPGDAGADSMVASGNVEFGVSYQESITQARVTGVPLVSIAAVIQHNTSGFAAPADKGIKGPKDFEGKVYGGWGSPVEAAVIESVMTEEGADINKVDIVNIGDSDFFTATTRDIDFAWIFYAWTGIEAQLRDFPIDMIYVKDLSEKLDYYTPVLATNEQLIAEQPELVEKFLAATAKGYQFSIDQPAEAADVLIAAVPELDPELVKASQEWLSPRYQDDAPRWGEQKKEVWSNYAAWMLEHKLLEGELDVDKAYTNEFLPEN